MQKIMNVVMCRGSLTDVIETKTAENKMEETKTVETSLATATFENTPFFGLEGPKTCKIVDIYDGDTFTAATDIPGQGIRLVKCRLMGVDTAEMRNDPKDPVHDRLKHLAYRARNKAAEFLIDLPPNFDMDSHLPRKQLRHICGENQREITVVFHGMGKYDRFLVEVPVETTSLTQILIDEGLGLAYDGGTKQSIHQLLTD